MRAVDDGDLFLFCEYLLRSQEHIVCLGELIDDLDTIAV